MPTVITAIANSEAEGFVAGTLYAQGWNVVFRAIDWASLHSYLEANSTIAANAQLLPLLVVSVIYRFFILISYFLLFKILLLS